MNDRYTLKPNEYEPFQTGEMMTKEKQTTDNPEMLPDVIYAHSTHAWTYNPLPKTFPEDLRGTKYVRADLVPVYFGMDFSTQPSVTTIEPDCVKDAHTDDIAVDKYVPAMIAKELVNSAFDNLINLLRKEQTPEPVSVTDSEFSHMQEFVESQYLPESGYTNREFEVAQEVTKHWLDRLKKSISAPAQKDESKLVSDAAKVDDLAAIVRQIVHRSRKGLDLKDICDKAMDYLSRKGLQGSPLRESDNETLSEHEASK